MNIEDGDPKIADTLEFKQEKERLAREKKEKERRDKIQKQKLKQLRDLADEDDLPIYKQRWLQTTCFGSVAFLIFIITVFFCS